MKKIGILIIQILVALVPLLAIITYTSRNIIAFADEEAPYYLWNKNYCEKKHDDSPKVIVLGDSAANAAYIPELLADNAVNLSLGGTTPVENYYIMSQWLDNNDAPKTVFISFMDFHFNTSDCFWGRCMYCHRFPYSVNKEIINEAKLKKENSIARYKCDKFLYEYECYFPNIYIKALCNGGLNQRRKDNEEKYALNSVFSGRYIARGITNGEIDSICYSEFKVGELFDEYYRKLIDLCVKNNCDVHLIKVPMASNISFSDEYRIQINHYYDELMSDYPQVTFEWFEEGYSSLYFADEYHMNNHGAFDFSTAVGDKYVGKNRKIESYYNHDAINRYILEEETLDWISRWSMICNYSIAFDENNPEINKELKHENMQNNWMNVQIKDNNNNLILEKCIKKY